MNQHANIATIGHNAPPSAFDEIAQEISDLYDEAKLWLDGEEITTQEQADALNTLSDKIKDAAKRAEELRKGEVKPFDDGKAEIQERYNPLIGKTKSVTGKTVMAIDCVKDALRPYLIELDRKQRAEAERLAAEARAKEADAIAAFQSVQTLEDREVAESALQVSKQADKQANAASKAKAHAKGSGRAVGLRTVPRAVMVDEMEAARWCWSYDKDAFMAFIQSQADRAAKAGAHTIGGFNIVEDKIL